MLPFRKFIPLLIFLSVANSASAQAFSGANIAIYSIVVVGVLLVLGVVMQVADNLIQIEAQKRQVQQSGIGLFPKLSSMFSPSLPAHLEEEDVHILKRGYDINLEGEAEGVLPKVPLITRYAVQPPNWRGIRPIPKMEVDIGDSVKAGDPLFFDKGNPETQFVAPVSGEIIEINRGAKRAITEVVILADKEQQSKEFDPPAIASASRDELVSFLQSSGGWVLIKQRPFDIVPDPGVEPANVFISTFDTGPLAPDLNLFVADRREDFQAGIDVLARLTHGKVHLGLDARDGKMPSDVFLNAENAQKHWFRGPHPAGNVGVQIHHIAPITSTSKVWTLDVQSVLTIGALFTRKVYDGSRFVALTGYPLQHRGYVKTYAGCQIGELIGDDVRKDRKVRLISGDALSGQAKQRSGYLNIFDDQVTVLEEGDKYDMFGWLVPSKLVPTVSRTYPNFLLPDLKFEADTNTHGEKRAFVVTGQYEKVLPMDIYPQHLMKAIITRNFERMEGLGIYELTEEDIALCEFSCTSKMPLQQLLREGLEIMQEQG